MKTLLEIQRHGEDQLGIFTLTTDYEIVYGLMDQGGISPDALQKLTRLSSTGFYNRVKRLHHDGVIISEVHPNDRRSRLYRLSSDMRRLIMNQHKGYMELVRSRVREAAPVGQNLGTYRSYIQKGAAVNHLTADFQILLYLYLKPGLSNLDISHVVDVSITKFHTSLTKLASMGLIEFDKDPSDGRSKLYRLSALSIGVLDVLHTKVFQWLEEREPVQDTSSST
jgi:DNA-binding MarR family transcriptional regulator